MVRLAVCGVAVVVAFVLGGSLAWAGCEGDHVTGATGETIVQDQASRPRADATSKGTGVRSGPTGVSSSGSSGEAARASAQRAEVRVQGGPSQSVYVVAPSDVAVTAIGGSGAAGVPGAAGR